MVFLTVEGGVSLVGPHCPGTIRLYCEGVDFPTFRWMYNGNIDIGNFYHADSTLGSQKGISNPAFVSVQLIAVSRPNSTDVRFANFSSILIVDLSQLEQQNITNISCGDPWISKTVPVNVHIAQDTVPGDPQFISTQLATILRTNEEQANLTTIIFISWMDPVRIVIIIIVRSLVPRLSLFFFTCLYI